MSVSIANVEAHYPESPPFHPSNRYPEYSGELSQKENPAYEGVRRALMLLGYDAEHQETSAWNPLGELISPGQTVFIKPNLVDHKHRFDEDVWSVITHPSVVRAVLDYVLIALEGEGRVIIGDNPHVDTLWEKLAAIYHFDALIEYAAQRSPGVNVEILDLRKWHMPNLEYYGFKMGREVLPGDPEGELLVDVKEDSLLEGVPKWLLRGTYNDRRETIRHHTGGSHLYSFSKTMWDADVFLSIPKLKAHAKVGVTLNIKGLIGTIINKNCLVHWRIGYPLFGGDEYPDPEDWIDYPKLYIQHALMDLIPSPLYFHLRKALRSTRFYHEVYNPRIRTQKQKQRMLRGAWDKNDTTWRMTVDVFNAFCRDITGTRARSGQRVRFLSIVDGILGGDTDGPHFPHPKEAGVVIAGEDFLEVDLVCARAMDFDYREIPYLAHLSSSERLNVEALDVRVERPGGDFFDGERQMLMFRPPHRWPKLSLHDLEPGPSFLPI